MDEDLKKAAEDAATECYNYTFQNLDDLIGLSLAGAEWMAKQGETYETRVMENGLSNHKIIQHTVESFEPDEQVIVQIRKI